MRRRARDERRLLDMTHEIARLRAVVSEPSKVVAILSDLKSEIGLIRSRVPFTPQDDRERSALLAFHKFARAVFVVPNDGDLGYRIVLDPQWRSDAVALSWNESIERLMSLPIFEVYESPLPRVMNNRRYDHLRVFRTSPEVDLAAYDLNDKGWAAVRAHFEAEEQSTWVQGQGHADLRTIAGALFIHLRTGAAYTALAKWCKPQYLRYRAGRLRKRGWWARIFDDLLAVDPAALAGADAAYIAWFRGQADGCGKD